jgi:hypothetical protein
MHKNEHSISIGMSHIGSTFFLKIIVKGRLTHEDYEKMIPVIENAIIGVEEPKIKVLVDAREFDGYDLQAAWDDLKFGLKHNKDFTKLAFVGAKSWEEYGVKISNWFMSGELKYFEDIDSAIKWLKEKKGDIITMDAMEKEFESREKTIKKELKFLFKANMRFTDWDVPEVDNKKAALKLHSILQDGLDKIKKDIDSGKFDN